MDHNIHDLPNEELIGRIKSHIGHEHQQQAEFLRLLGEMDVRKLYAELGYPSLFAYCTQALGLAEGCAYRRIHAARAARRFPVIYDLIARGETHCAAISMIRPHLADANISTLLPSICQKSKREVELIIAALAPLPDVPDVMRKLPIRNTTTCPGASCASVASPSPVSTALFESVVAAGDAVVESAGHTLGSMAQNLEPALQPATMDQRMTPLAPAASTCITPPAPAEDQHITPLSPTRIKFQFTASEEFREKFARAKALLWHKYPDGDFERIFSDALDALLAKKDPSRRGLRVTRDVASGRHVPAQIKRRVWMRDGGRCQFVAKSGQRCGATAALEFDHIQPFAHGGSSTDADNIRLLCRTHNQWRAQTQRGLDLVGLRG